MCWLFILNSRTYLEVSFSHLQTVILVGTFHGSLALVGQVLSVAGVLLGKAKEGINGLLV